jgi:hypothetical protein
MNVLHIQAHSRDCNTAEITDGYGHTIWQHTGYVPQFFPCGHGDDLILTIDIDTGMIIGWDEIKANIEELLAQQSEEE